MAIDFRCPRCGHQTHVPARYAGQTGPCAGCRQTVTIPAAGGVPAPRASGRGSGSKSALAAFLVAGALAVVALVAVIFLLYVGLTESRDAARRAACGNCLKQIGLGLHGYAADYKCFPPAYSVDAEGRPLHSWRVLILPYMDEAALYQQVRLDEPWDSPHNAALARYMPLAFRCPGHEDDGSFHTHYLAIVGEDTTFPGAEPLPLNGLPDGFHNTLAVAETTESAHWMEPRDMPFDGMSFTINDSAGHALGGPHSGGVMVLLSDDAVRFVPETVSRDFVRRLVLRNDAELVDWDEAE